MRSLSQALPSAVSMSSWVGDGSLFRLSSEELAEARQLLQQLAAGQALRLTLIFEALVSEQCPRAPLLVKARAFLLALNETGSDDGVLMGRTAQSILKRYQALYASVGLLREGAMRECKRTELILTIVGRLEWHSWVRVDPLSKPEAKAIISLMESVSVLLVAPGAWQDFIDFCFDRFSPTLPSTLAYIFQRLEVEPHVREKAVSMEVLLKRSSSGLELKRSSSLDTSADGLLEPARPVLPGNAAASANSEERKRPALPGNAAASAKSEERKRAPLKDLNALRNKDKDKRKKVAAPSMLVERKVHAKTTKGESKLLQ
jgi:hypothetical protein